MWPTEYGGGGLSLEQTKVLYEEMSAIDARPPLRNMGTRMLGPRSSNMERKTKSSAT